MTKEQLVLTLTTAVLSGGLVSGLMAILLAWLQRKWRKSDSEEDKIQGLVNAQKVLMIDRVRYLGGEYIARQEITLEDKENLRDMYAAYKALGGNGHLETVMAEVDRLPVVTR